MRSPGRRFARWRRAATRGWPEPGVAGVAVPGQVPGAGAGAADLPGAAAEQVARARAGARSSPCESAAPTRAQAPLPANPSRRVTRRRARPARPAAWMRQAALEPPAPEAELTWPVAPEVRAGAPALVRRPQPEERAAQASAVRVVRARVPPALVPRVPVKRVPVAVAPLPAPESVGCSSPEARSRGLQPVRWTAQCRTATTPASPAPSAVLAARRRGLEARAWRMVIDPRRASPALWAGRRATRRSWSAPLGSSPSARPA